MRGRRKASIAALAAVRRGGHHVAGPRGVPEIKDLAGPGTGFSLTGVWRAAMLARRP